MRIIILLTLISVCTYFGHCGAFSEVTNVYNQLFTPNRTLPYKIFSGYEDINWYISGSQASIYYSLWECSTKRLIDHSAPVIIYLAGGPGRSSQFTAFRQFGPIQITFKDGKYSASQNPWSWNYYGHLVFVDQPAGVGFSFNNGKKVTNSTVAAQHVVNFLFNFVRNGLSLSTNPFYLAGEGYGGHILPLVFQMVNKNRTMGFSIEGIILGGAFVDPQKQINFYSSVLAAAGIVSQKHRNQTNSWSTQGILKIRNSLYSQVRPLIENIWSPAASQEYYNGMDIHNYKRYAADTQGSDYVSFLTQRKTDLKIPEDVKFIEFNNQINQALSEDMFRSYVKSMDYMLGTGKRVLIYNGQNDFIVSTPSVLTWLQNVEWYGAQQWRQSKKQIWRESGKIAGWVKRYRNLIFTIIKGAGHYIYQDETSAARSMYLMINNYLTKKW